MTREDDREASHDGERSAGAADGALLSALADADRPGLTTGEAADAADLSRGRARARLQALADDGAVARRRAGTTVRWVHADRADEYRTDDAAAGDGADDEGDAGDDTAAGDDTGEDADAGDDAAAGDDAGKDADAGDDDADDGPAEDAPVDDDADAGDTAAGADPAPAAATDGGGDDPDGAGEDADGHTEAPGAEDGRADGDARGRAGDDAGDADAGDDGGDPGVDDGSGWIDLAVGDPPHERGTTPTETAEGDGAVEIPVEVTTGPDAGGGRRGPGPGGGRGERTDAGGDDRPVGGAGSAGPAGRPAGPDPATIAGAVAAVLGVVAVAVLLRRLVGGE